MANCYLIQVILIVAGAFVQADCKLSPKFYSLTCPNALPIVQAAVIAAIENETRMGASLLRLHFHDCFVNGCDGSVLLDDTADFVGEKTAAPNNNSLRGFNVIDDIKAQLEKACPGVVSCADILALAARDSVAYVGSIFLHYPINMTLQLGGPSWKVGLGRRDSTCASRAAANTSIPAPISDLSDLQSSFSAQGLSLKDLVALSGSHTIGLARCISFRARIYNDSNIDASFANTLQRSCPRNGHDNRLARLDLQTPSHFDNLYFENLLRGKGLLHSDQVLFNESYADFLVKRYAKKSIAFFKDFARSMVKMGNIRPLTGSNGEIRINCRKVNKLSFAYAL